MLLLLTIFHASGRYFAYNLRTSSESVINALKTVFSHHGIPETLVSNIGAQYSSVEFAAAYEFTHNKQPALTPEQWFCRKGSENGKETLQRVFQQMPSSAVILHNTPALVFSGSIRAMSRETPSV